MSVRFDPAALELLAELEANNHRAWFSARADTYRRLLLDPFEAVLVEASARLGDTVWPVRGGRRTMSRPLRDQRHARDAPYRTCVRGLLTSTGTVPTREGCVHVELDRAAGFVGVGFHRPPRAQLDPIRARMLDEPSRWRGVRDDLAACGRELVADRLVRMPSGFTAAALHEHADDVRLRSLVIVHRLSPDDWTSGEAVGRIVDAARDGAALLHFGNTAGAAAVTTSVPGVDGHVARAARPDVR